MTNLEAIKILDNLKPGDYSNPYEKGEAIVMAISALQAQEAKTQLSAEGTTNLQPTCNKLATDCISRQAAIDELKERIIANGYSNVALVSELNRSIGYLMRLPSVTPKCPECDDVVSRRAAIDVAENAFVRGLLASPDIRRLPSAQPEPQWIPVSERLPEKYGNYLISIHGEDEPDIGTINPNDKKGWSLCDANGFHWASDKKLIVTAWMPLPEPYREERRTDGKN